MNSKLPKPNTNGDEISEYTPNDPIDIRKVLGGTIKKNEPSKPNTTNVKEK